MSVSITAALVVLALLCVTYLSITLFLRGGLLSIPPAGSEQFLTYSVVIAAHNEETVIEECLAHVLRQTIDAERFEVIVADDRSTDGTAAAVEAMLPRYANLRLVRITHTPPGLSPKKHALSLALTHASNDVIVYTDADCLVPPVWLARIDRYMGPDVGLVQGVTTYADVRGMSPVFYGLQAVDFLSHGVVAAAAIGAGLPINSNANNFAFRRSAFEEVGGYGEAAGVISGDDDLLLQRVARSGRWKVRFMADPEGAVHTLPTPSAAGVFEQRKRWGSKTVHYRPAQVALLAAIFSFYLGMVGALALGFVRSEFAAAFCAMLLVKIGGEYLLMVPGLRIFRQTGLRPYLLGASLIQLPLAVAAVILGVFGRFTWKGQRFARKA